MILIKKHQTVYEWNACITGKSIACVMLVLLIWTMEYQKEVFVVRYILSVVYGLCYKFTNYLFTIMTFD
jgi:hypothetical protein